MDLVRLIAPKQKVAEVEALGAQRRMFVLDRLERAAGGELREDVRRQRGDVRAELVEQTR